MKKCKKCSEKKTENLFYKDSLAKDGLRATCKECDKAHGKKYSAENKEKEAARYKKYAEANKEKIDKKSRETKAINSEKITAYAKEYYRKNSGKRLENSKKWYQENSGTDSLKIKIRLKSSTRRVAKLNADVSWSSKSKIKEFYDLAHAETKKTGIQHEVDHIIPLQGKLVCGLHVEFNLQILTRSQNASKGNR